MDKSFGPEFSSMELKTLLSEPSRLESSIAALQSQFDESMARNYDCFIKTCDDASTITDDLEKCSSCIGELGKKLTEANSLCKDLCLEANQTREITAKISSAYSQVTDISEIFNVPQNMKSCRISCLYDEALQFYNILEQFARQFPNLPALQITLQQASAEKKEVTQSLLNTFSNEKLSLNDAISHVNLLRTAKVQSEAEIRLAFVNGRIQSMKQENDRIPKDDRPLFIEKLTNNYRTTLFNIATQYRAILRTEDAEDDMTLHLILQNQSQEYCNTLKETLDKVTKVEEAKDILTTAFYFATSFARLGFDFSPMVESIFYY